MTENHDGPANAGQLSREERLAAKLRENLRRRKAQARTLEGQDNPTLSKEPGNS